MRGAHCWTDHRLVVTKLRLRLQLPRRSGKPKPYASLIVDGLKDPVKRGNNNPLSASGEGLIKSKEEVLKRWTEHFSCLLNVDRAANLEHIRSIPQLPIFTELDNSLSREEIALAINQQKNKRAVVVEVPYTFKASRIKALYKNRGDRSCCDSYRGISLLSVPGKVFARVLLNRLMKLSEQLLPETQFGFRPERGTCEAIFSIRQLQEKSIEQGRHLYLCFVDLEKAFDSMPREALWIVLSKIGCTEKFVRLLHDDMECCVAVNDEQSEFFAVTCGVKQTCVLAPTHGCS
ncbi:unnamed protein product [Euphydryas editha]|uniref:Reverse transcriptase domain-containing protein n=1 Tax=Euphydryas editha TaxID=104508 RepID=A0AAU9V3T1_EUPED|nr:unnamed protein product [Euphydryas editha]